MRPLVVSTSQRAYPIHFATDDWRGLARFLKTHFSGTQIGLVTSPAVATHYLEALARALTEADLTHHSFIVPDGEANKTLRTVERLYGNLIAAGMGRRDPLVALGGGVIGDMVGFAAATYLRGVPYIQVPTTLLAQVDSSVGGKTGVDHRLGKNLIGAFYQPHLVWMNLSTLTSLPERQIRAGFAEIIKYGAIADARLFNDLSQLSKRDIVQSRFLRSEPLAQIIRRSCAIKAKIVGADEQETSGLRALLNFGHTLGHAIEAACTYESFLHGEAVAIGMIIAARISSHLGICASRDVERLRACVETLGLQTDLSDGLKRRLTAKKLVSYVLRDKKRHGQTISFVVLEKIGRAKLAKLALSDLESLVKASL